MTQYRNERTHDVVVTDLTAEQLANEFVRLSSESNWLWYHIAKFVRDNMPASQEDQDMIAFLRDSFVYAIGKGLKKPMIRLHYKDARYKIYLSKHGTVCFKTGALVAGTHDPVGDEVYMGRVLANGSFDANKTRQLTDTNKEFMERLGKDPVGFMAEASKDMNRCCYCNKPLTDDRSKTVGYGKECANKWGLPWGRKDYDDKVPSFAQVWRNAHPDDARNVRLLCAAVRQNPTDPLNWEILSDALKDVGFQDGVKMPGVGVVVPRDTNKF